MMFSMRAERSVMHLQKVKTKQYVDARRYARPSGIDVGDVVLVNNQTEKKISSISTWSAKSVRIWKA